MKFPIKVTLTTAFVMFTSFAVGLVALSSYLASRNLLLEQAHKNISDTISAAQQGVERTLSSATLTSETVASLPASVVDWRHPESLLLSLTFGFRNAPDLYSAYVGFPDGGFVQSINLIGPGGTLREIPGVPSGTAYAWRIISGEDTAQGRVETWHYFDINDIPTAVSKSSDVSTEEIYDPRNRTWFNSADRSGGTELSDVYIYASLKKAGITASTPTQNRKGAVAGADLTLDSLANLVQRLRPGLNGVVAVIDQNHNMVAHPDPEKITRTIASTGGLGVVPVTEIDDPRLRAAVLDDKLPPSEGLKIAINEEEYIAYSKPALEFGTAAWRIIGVAAVADFTSGMVAALHRSLLIAGAVLIAAVVGVYLMAGWVASPIVALRDLAEKIANLNFSGSTDIRSPFYEIQQLQQTMDKMRQALDGFLRFVPHEVGREMVQSGKPAIVGGTRREVTVMFSDIENFTSLSERRSPEDIMAQISEYFEGLSFCIQANRGTIDKFIGDAIMAMWNAPSEDSMHVDNACRGVLSARAVSEDINADFEARGLPIFRTRFGLHTDEVLVGNVSAGDRLQFTCLGAFGRCRDASILDMVHNEDWHFK